MSGKKGLLEGSYVLHRPRDERILGVLASDAFVRAIIEILSKAGKYFSIHGPVVEMVTTLGS